MKTTGYSQLAERYASALFDVAKEASAIAPVEKDLRAFSAALATSHELSDFLVNPLLSRAAQQDICKALLAKMGAHALTGQFFAMLAANKRLAATQAIIQAFLTKTAHARGEMQAEVISAQALGKKETDEIAARLERTYGKKVQLSTRQNPDLLGGVVIKIAGKQLDASLSGKLERLGQSLKVA